MQLFESLMIFSISLLNIEVYPACRSSGANIATGTQYGRIRLFTNHIAAFSRDHCDFFYSSQCMFSSFQIYLFPSCPRFMCGRSSGEKTSRAVVWWFDLIFIWKISVPSCNILTFNSIDNVTHNAFNGIFCGLLRFGLILQLNLSSSLYSVLLLLCMLFGFEMSYFSSFLCGFFSLILLLCVLSRLMQSMCFFGVAYCLNYCP